MYPSSGPSLSAEPLPWTCNRLPVNVPGLEIFFKKKFWLWKWLCLEDKVNTTHKEH